MLSQTVSVLFIDSGQIADKVDNNRLKGRFTIISTKNFVLTISGFSHERKKRPHFKYSIHICFVILHNLFLIRIEPIEKAVRVYNKCYL